MNSSRYLATIIAAVIMTSCNEDQPAARSEEPQTPSSKKPKASSSPLVQESKRKHPLPKLATVVTSIDIKTLPKELRAQSAIQITDQEQLASITQTPNATFSFPLSKTETAEFVVSKVVTNQDLSILFGQLTNGQKSHYKLVFDKGSLHSGTVNLRNSQYQLTTLKNGSLILSHTDPEIHLPACGCESCVQQKP